MAIRGTPLFRVAGKSLEDPNKITLAPDQLQGDESAERPPVPAPVDEVAVQHAIDVGVQAGVEGAQHFIAIANQIRLLAPLNVLVFGLAEENALFVEANGTKGEPDEQRRTLFVEYDAQKIAKYQLDPKWQHAQILKVDLPPDGGLPDFPAWMLNHDWEVIVVGNFGKVDRRWDGEAQRWVHDVPVERRSALRIAGRLFKPGYNWAFVSDYDTLPVFQWCSEYLKSDTPAVIKARRGNPGQFQKKTGVWEGPHRRGTVRYV